MTYKPSFWPDEEIDQFDFSESYNWPHTLSDPKAALLAYVLAQKKWVRVFARRNLSNCSFLVLRISILPDDVGRRFLERDDRYARKCLVDLIEQVDISLDAWEGRKVLQATRKYDFGSQNDDSLFYLFNTLPSPKFDALNVSCPASDDAIKSVCNSDLLPELKTPLYPYQKRTVATMIKREVSPARTLDPRLQPLLGPTGVEFYYDVQNGLLLRGKREYDEARGGILGESMGLGKTLICLSTILATKGHWPSIPPEYSVGLHPIRPTVASLAQMAAAAVGRAQIPWRSYFQDLSAAGEDHENCLALLENNSGSYLIPAPVPRRSRRPSFAPAGKTIRLCPATLVIVPQNLLSQWRKEISSHISKGGLKVLYLDSNTETAIPSADKLLQYDVILLSRQRFESEIVPGESIKFRSKAKGGCSCSLDEDCRCSTNDEYQSPLKDLHFLRIIMDEGHEFSSSGQKNKTYWALQELRVDRKWIVSGTPASGLIGVEVGTATFETSDLEMGTQSVTANSKVLLTRKKESALSQERKDLEKLGGIVAGFLQLKPWSNSNDQDHASWRKYIMPYENGRRKPRSLKTLLESLVVRHRIEDIEKDIQLPPLHNRVVHLQPSWHDKLSINLFILSLIANAVTSEHVDEDYMFHTKNRRALNQLISNLRQSGFYWTSFTPEDVAKTLRVSRTYLDEHSLPDSACNDTDKQLLEQAIVMGELVLQSESWKAFACLHEMGFFVENFPAAARNEWSMVPCNGQIPLLIGATQAKKAQEWVDNHLYMNDPSQGLATIGASTMRKSWQEAEHAAAVYIPEDPLLASPDNSPPRRRKKSRTLLSGTPRVTEERTVSRAKAAPSLVKRANPHASQHVENSNLLKPALKSILKSSTTNEPAPMIPPDSPLANTQISGTASAKLSYLLDRVIALHQDEKILIFYEGDQIAYYIAQAFDLVDIRYLIYTTSLSQVRQNAYITTFNTTGTFRVLLMNVHQAAHGLHIASASRVFFVNPVWQPNVEAQAIKRAHRIGQTRPVYVETLVLKDTLEDQMLQRRKGMSAEEHQKAEKSLLDDDTMSSIIKNAKLIPLLDEELRHTNNQVARLQTPQQLFGRVCKATGDVDDPDADLIFPVDSPRLNKKNKKKRAGSRFATDLTGSPPPSKRANLSVEQTGQGESSRTSLVAAAAGTSGHQTPASDASRTAPTPRRVGFAVEDDASSSLFGASVSAPA